MKRGRRSFSVALVGRSVLVVKLRKDVAQLVRNGQADMRGILEQAEAFIAHVEADHGPAQSAAGAYNMQIDRLFHSNEIDQILLDHIRVPVQ